MFQSSASFQSSMFGSFAYGKILERRHDHLLMRMLRAIDFSFITPLVSDCYSFLGRKAYDPICSDNRLNHLIPSITATARWNAINVVLDIIPA